MSDTTIAVLIMLVIVAAAAATVAVILASRLTKLEDRTTRIERRITPPPVPTYQPTRWQEPDEEDTDDDVEEAEVIEMPKAKTVDSDRFRL